METFVSGPGMSADYKRHTGQELDAAKLHERALHGEEQALACLFRHCSRLGRGLAMICNIYDPDAIVLGGGLSRMSHLYEQLPAAMAPYLFCDDKTALVLPPKHGDASGVRGAAWLWNEGHDS